MKKFMTTSEAADVCGVVHTTIIRWINEGKLKAHETPGGHRRIDHWDLVHFLKQYKIPVPRTLDDGRFKVLAVDDETKVLTMLRKAFSAHADEIDFCATTSGMEALVMLGKTRFDLLILDVAMPDMDGVQVCITIKQNPDLADLKILVITGRQLLEEQEEYLKKNVEEIIKKPFSTDELMDKVKAMM